MEHRARNTDHRRKRGVFCAWASSTCGYRLSLLLLLATTAAVLTGCAGGSGSSGFDIASASEAAAIQRALDQNECVERKGLTICPANDDSAAVPGTPSGTPTPPAEHPQINTNLDHASATACLLQATDNSCNVAVQFSTRGFPGGTQFFLAARNNQENAPWVINQQLARDAGNGAFDAPLNVPAQGLEIQVAVLVFDNTPQSLPAQVTELSESGASFAYVTHVLMLAPTN